MENNYSVYLHKCPDGTIYAGQSGKDKLTYRWGPDGSQYKMQPEFYDKILEFGWDNIEHIELYSNLSQEEANEKEVEVIESYGGINDPKVLNSQSGGKNNFKESEKQKQKISDGVKRFYDKNPEKRDDCRNRMIERYSDQNERDKQSENMKKMYEKNSDKLERVIKQITSQEMREKQLEAVGIKVDIYDKDFNFIKTVPSIHHAARETGIDPKAVAGRIKKSYTKLGDPLFRAHGEIKINPIIEIKKGSTCHPVCQIDMETKEVVARYFSCSEASRALNIDPNIGGKAISTAASKCRKQNKYKECFGFFWQYADDYDKEHF